jgi:hypothetical protein
MKRTQFISGAISSSTDECIMWPYAVRKSSGYGAYDELREDKRYSVDVHRYVCRSVNGEPPSSGHQAAHRCGNKLCINPKHLHWATPLENMRDAKEHGTLRGGGRYRQRFFDREIAEIMSSGESLITLAKRFNSEAAYIGRIRRAHSVSGGANV